MLRIQFLYVTTIITLILVKIKDKTISKLEKKLNAQRQGGMEARPENEATIHNKVMTRGSTE
jgi:hypothetical protein